MTHLRRKQRTVEAYLHDGSDEKAFAIAEWICKNGGKATALLKGGSDLSPDWAVIRLNESVLTNLIPPNFWVVDMGGGAFISVPDSVMRVAYDIIEEEL